MLSPVEDPHTRRIAAAVSKSPEQATMAASTVLFDCFSHLCCQYFEWSVCLSLTRMQESVFFRTVLFLSLSTVLCVSE